jgi:hypothetical protein
LINFIFQLALPTVDLEIFPSGTLLFLTVDDNHIGSSSAVKNRRRFFLEAHPKDNYEH